MHHDHADAGMGWLHAPPREKEMYMKTFGSWTLISLPLSPPRYLDYTTHHAAHQQSHAHDPPSLPPTPILRHSISQIAMDDWTIASTPPKGGARNV